MNISGILDKEKLRGRLSQSSQLRAWIGRFEGCMTVGHGRSVLDEAAESLADCWRNSAAYDAESREAFCRWQARLIAGYDGCSDEFRNYYLAARHLEFILAEPFLAPRGPCPVAALSNEEASLLSRLTLRRAQAIHAHLMFAVRAHWGMNGSHHQGSDYDVAERRLRRALGFCRNPRSDCFAILRGYLLAAWPHLRASPDGFRFDRLAICAAKQEDSALSKPEDIGSFVDDFYGWVEQECDTSNADSARRILRWFYDQPDIVSVLEMTFKCYLCSRYQGMEREDLREPDPT